MHIQAGDPLGKGRSPEGGGQARRLAEVGSANVAYTDQQVAATVGILISRMVIWPRPGMTLLRAILLGRLSSGLHEIQRAAECQNCDHKGVYQVSHLCLPSP